MTELPTFRYHPNPMATGSVQASIDPCGVCGLDRGLVYSGPVYCALSDEPLICPWCIADGSAATTLQAEFTDVGWGVPDNVSVEILEEVAHRTPGFSGWQQEHWLYHCGDAAAFLGRVGHRELEGLPGAMEMLLHENDAIGWSRSQAEAYVSQLDPDGEATGYWFRCLVCGVDLAYSDEA